MAKETCRNKPIAVACALALSAAASTGLASSHREAPFITTQPKVDGTDFYMFRSYEPGRENLVTIVANYLPLQDPYGGPNYFSMDENALYEIHIDNDGDAREDLTFQFRFMNRLRDIQLPIGGKNVSVPLINVGGITGSNTSALNVIETYTIDVMYGDRRGGRRQPVTRAGASGDAARQFTKPVDFVGTKTFGSVANYESYANGFIHDINIPGCGFQGRVFVGQRKDPFVVNLGRTFDLLNLNPLATSGGTDDLADKNVTSLALEVPAVCLIKGNEPVIGGWTTASKRQVGLLDPTPSPGLQTPEKAGGSFVQVSRLGMPLVNEVVIGLKDKDRFNSSKPFDDAQFLDYVTNPTLPAIIEALFGPSAGVKAPTNFPRNDLVKTFLTGLPGLNQPANVTPSEMLRLNTGVSPKPRGGQNPLGVIANDGAGFPNGRRPGDDVVDIALRVVMGKLCTFNASTIFGCTPADAPSGSVPFTDGGTNTSDANFDNAFPYLRTPLPGAQ